ncbi:hypothetical protein KIW84_073662 [Lathyrus oleraceus]|uniref:Uncharacterized protein n=1 Tax=Pisum sativum TaxID=3888 RepID=A0A9D4VPJ0_PEA|nr:hypothetical protein KIW84_073662 [Pisum sativum]
MFDFGGMRDTKYELSIPSSNASSSTTWACFTLGLLYLGLQRNQGRFNNKRVHWKYCITTIISDSSWTGNNSNKASRLSMPDFAILKVFKITIRSPKTPVIKEILWPPPMQNWTKCNTDGVFLGVPNTASRGGIFRNDKGDHLRSFAFRIGNGDAFIT